MNRVIAIFCFASFFAFATDPYPRTNPIDVLHYTFRLELNDTTDVIVGNADITVRFTRDAGQFHFNLADWKSDGTGMRIFGVTQSGKPVLFSHDGEWVNVELTGPARQGDTATYSVSYSGIPRDGLTIGKNKFGDRTFFGDNWPDRGHNWLPVVDHPSDKSKVDFIITAPNHYRVIATGELVGERDRQLNRKESHWREKTDVAIKVITIGVARFSVQQSGMVGNIPVTTWVFPQNEKAGFVDFAVAPEVLKFMQDFVGPFPYEKLAHVQSKTRWGGLENASNIFYFENSVTGKNEREGLIAHETAHQWFGNSVTEDDWHHVWLSEGFATYFNALYMGAKYGDDRLRSEMQENRKAVIEYTRKNRAQVIDTTIQEIGKVLNTSTYQKGAWVLHMLRAKVGADNFQKGIREYYRLFRDGNAMTEDFIAIMENAAGQQLDDFFTDWLYQAGHPRVSGTWHYNDKTDSLTVDLKFTDFKLAAGQNFEISVVPAKGKNKIIKYPLTMGAEGLTATIRESFPARPTRLVLDPGVTLLFEGQISEKR